MSTPDSRPIRRAARRPVTAVIAILVLAVVTAGCGISRDAAEGLIERDADRIPPAELAYVPPVVENLEAPAGLLAADAVTPATAPTGTPYRRCVVDYRTVDWEAEPAALLATHHEAAAQPCTEADWYRDVAFQNGILGFMALVGEAELQAAAPASDAAPDMVASLRAQGFDRLAVLEIAGSGSCDEGEVQAAVLRLQAGLTGGAAELRGLEAMVVAATTSGATVTAGTDTTIIAGGGAPCTTAIVHDAGVLAWITAGDKAVLHDAVDSLRS